MDTQMEKLLAAQERALQQKNEADRKAKQAKKQIEDQKRKRRTQRLIVRGAILEKFIPNAETLSDDDVSALLSGLLNKPDNQRWLKTWLEAHRTEEPMGNQTSQWFALFYLDPLDRLVKERLRIKYYTRYMDDCILIHHSKDVLHRALLEMRALLKGLGLSFNEKTQIFPISHGVEYLGWRFYLTDTGAVVRRLKKHSKNRWKHRLRKLKSLYSSGDIEIQKILESVQSFHNHMSYGNTWKLYHRVMDNYVLTRSSASREEPSSQIQGDHPEQPVFDSR